MVRRRSRPKLGSCPAMHDAHGKFPEPPHRGAVDGDVGAWEFVEELAVVDRVAGEQGPRRCLPQPDGSW